MKVTFILKDKTDWYFHGNAGRYPEGHVMCIVGLLNLSSNLARLLQLSKESKESYLNVKMKVGSSHAFRDQVELNQLVRAAREPSFKLENRKGYKLATFQF